MNYLIDIILLLIIALTTFIGYKRGLIKIAFKFVGFILAIIISILLYKPLANFIINYTTIDDTIEVTVENRLSSSNITKEEKDNIISNYYSNIKNSSISVVSEGISKTIINVGCMLLVFIISNIILLFLKFSGDLIAKLPLIKQCNSIGGFIYGLLQGFLLIYTFLAIIAILSPIIDINEFINIINSSVITHIMYNNNIILILFT